MSGKILIEKQNGVLTLTLNRPEKLNCIDQEMLQTLENQVDKAAKDAATRVVIFKGAGDRAFSSGADLKAFQALTKEEADEWIIAGNRIFNKVEQLPKPTIAIIQGYALGGGLELALACDFRIGTEEAVVANPELQHGWLPGWGGMARLRRLIGEAKAKEVVLLCEKIPAQEAYRLGLFTKVVSKEEVNKEVEKLTTHFLERSPKAFALAKSVLMDEEHGTSGTGIWFDVLAMNLARE